MNRSDIEKVFAVLRKEREYQIAQHGDDENTSIGDFLVYMELYLLKAKQSLLKSNSHYTTREMITKITALGVAAMERH